MRLRGRSPWSRRAPSRAGRELLAAAALVATLEARAGETWAIEHARLIPSATGPVVEGGTVLVRDGRVKALGPSPSVRVPGGARRVDGSGGPVLPCLLYTSDAADERSSV